MDEERVENRKRGDYRGGQDRRLDGQRQQLPDRQRQDERYRYHRQQEVIPVQAT